MGGFWCQEVIYLRGLAERLQGSVDAGEEGIWPNYISIGTTTTAQPEF